MWVGDSEEWNENSPFPNRIHQIQIVSHFTNEKRAKNLDDFSCIWIIKVSHSIGWMFPQWIGVCSNGCRPLTIEWICCVNEFWLSALCVMWVSHEFRWDAFHVFYLPTYHCFVSIVSLASFISFNWVSSSFRYSVMKRGKSENTSPFSISFLGTSFSCSCGQNLHSPIHSLIRHQSTRKKDDEKPWEKLCNGVVRVIGRMAWV